MQRRSMTTFLTVVLLASATVSAPAQEARVAAFSSQPSALSPLLLKRVSVHFQNVTPAIGLARLHEASGVPISFSPTMLPRDIRVSCRCDDVTLRAALDETLRGSGFDFVEMAGQIVIVKQRLEQPATRLASPRAAAPRHVSDPPPISTPHAFLGRATALSGVVPKAQGQVVGTVAAEETGEPIAAAQVFLEGTDISTLSGEQGEFGLSNVPAGTYTIVAQRIGFRAQRADLTVAAGETTTVSILLAESVLALDELVVTGYATQTRGAITGSIAVVDMDAVRAIPATSAAHALQGHAAGINVISSGLAGQAPEIRIRGITNFGNVYPLVLIDGVEGDLNNISAHDIESIQILKDAGAAAVYGARGANGVIIVTTRQGQTGAPVFTYEGYYGVRRPFAGNPKNMMNSTEFMNTILSVNPNHPNFPGGRMPDYYYVTPSGARGAAFEGDPEVDPSLYFFDPTDPRNNYQIQPVNKAGTDWYAEMMSPAPMFNHNLSVAGGSDRSSYRLSVGYLDQGGTLLNTSYRRYSVRVNSSYQPSNRFRMGQNLNASFTDNPTVNLFGELTLGSFLNVMPIIPVRDIAGNFAGTRPLPDGGNQRNPVHFHHDKKDDRNYSWNTIGNIYAELDVLRNLTARTSLGGNLTHGQTQSFIRKEYARAEFFNQPVQFNESQGYDLRYVFTNTATWRPSLSNPHDFTIMAGTEAIENYGRTIGGSRQDYLVDTFDYMTFDAGTSNMTNFGNVTQDRLFSVFTNVNYAYDNRYLFGATLRRDGSSRFGEENRYGVFPSFSAGWRISSEGFLRHVQWLDDMRLRGSYGVLGSQANVAAVNQFDIYSSSLQGASYDITGSSNSVLTGLYQTRIGNPRTSWERNIVANVGLDVMVRGNLSLTAEVYRKWIDGLLFQLAEPGTAGGGTRPSVNAGDIRNTGVDFEVAYRGSAFGGLRYNVAANVGHYRNVVVHVPGDADWFGAAGNVRNQEGHPVSSFFGLRVIGMYQTDEEVETLPGYNNAQVGRFIYQDTNGDGVINDDDRVHLGDPNPDLVGGANAEVYYGRFDLSANIYGSYGNKVNQATMPNTHTVGTFPKGLSRDLLNAWSPDNPDTMIPRLDATGMGTLGTFSSEQVKDGSFLRMRSMMIGYTLPDSALRPLGLNRVRVYAQGTNLFTLTRYDGVDPEISGGAASFGVDSGTVYSGERLFTVGLNVGF